MKTVLNEMENSFSNRPDLTHFKKNSTPVRRFFSNFRTTGNLVSDKRSCFTKTHYTFSVEWDLF